MSDADLGGDPPCWAHLFEDDDEDIESTSSDDASPPESADAPNLPDG